MNHPQKNKFNSHFFRQSLIGLGLGLLVIFAVSPFMQKQHKISTMVFDSEMLNVEPPKKINEQNNAQQFEISKNQMDNNVEYYPFFAINRSPITTPQYNAITNDTPRLTIIVNNVGQSRKMSALFLEKLPPNTTISLSPYLKKHNSVVNQFHDYGFETWTDLSTLTMTSQTDKGNNALSPINNLEANIELLSKQLSNKDKVAGVVLPSQALITETPKLWQNIVSDLFTSGYGILDNTKKLAKPSLYVHNGKRAPYIKGDITLSDKVKLANFESQLNKISQNTINHGNMIVTISITTPATLDILSQWLDSLEEKNIILLPLSAQAKL